MFVVVVVVMCVRMCSHVSMCAHVVVRVHVHVCTSPYSVVHGEIDAVSHVPSSTDSRASSEAGRDAKVVEQHPNQRTKPEDPKIEQVANRGNLPLREVTVLLESLRVESKRIIPEQPCVHRST